MKSEKTMGLGKISLITLTVLNISAIVSLRGLPAEAEYGLGSIFYYVFAALVFLVPVSLVSAELASGWPEKGGVYRWVGEAFGARAGFLAIWLQWIQNTIWFPTVLTFSAVSLAFIAKSGSNAMNLASNKIYVFIICMTIYWLATLANLRGIKSGARLSKYCSIIGTIIPAALLIIFGITWVIQGQPIQMSLSTASLIPDFSKLNNLVLASSIFLFFAGMEVSAVHVKEIDNPKKNYPRAIFLSAIITLIIFIAGTLAIGFVIPKTSINLTQGVLVAFDNYLDGFGLGFFKPLIALSLALGVIGGVSTWIGGPSKGLLAVGHTGLLPKKLQKVNKNGVQSNILILQGIIVTVLITLFVFLPSVQSTYQILSQLTAMLYLIMYMMLFAAGIKLRIKQPTRERTFQVPGGKYGMFLFGGIGFLACFVDYCLSFLPPSQIKVGNSLTWYLILIAGTILFVSAPMIMYQIKKPSWKDPQYKNDIEPFSWESENHEKKLVEKEKEIEINNHHNRFLTN